ncbi:hypothetical protein D8674_022825 [Pyrus ussuriensis x Pyrus communis]|uniref:Uncharacterized protein n=1 Tax=Pyrus ussuriensis x Pyrus communis TaxID=2448454 RepID=A0A5N5GM81_9ROSA|nr:hypothetical protein D8674_022825 [Pyrus ussuriensis x Pyrus communis]
MHDRAIMQLITATLSSTAVSCIIGNTSSNEMWMNLKEIFSPMTKTSIFQLKTELQNIKKSSDSVSEYLQKIKDARDHLVAAEVVFEDDDIIIIAFKELTTEYNTFRCVIKGRKNGISIKDFRSQLLAEEANINQSLELNLSFGTVMMAANQTSKRKALVLDSNSINSSNYGSSSGSRSNQHNSSNSQSYSSGNQHSYNNGNYNGGYNGGYRGNNYRGKGKSKFNYNSGSRFHTPNNNPGILGAPKPYQSTYLVILQLTVFKGIHILQAAHHHLFNLFNAITEGILHIMEGLMHLHSSPFSSTRLILDC